jgi:hypothetical protein
VLPSFTTIYRPDRFIFYVTVRPESEGDRASKPHKSKARDDTAANHRRKYENAKHDFSNCGLTAFGFAKKKEDGRGRPFLLVWEIITPPNSC